MRQQENAVVGVRAVKGSECRHAVADSGRAHLDLVGRRVGGEHSVLHVEPEYLRHLRGRVGVQVEHAPLALEGCVATTHRGRGRDAAVVGDAIRPRPGGAARDVEPVEVGRRTSPAPQERVAGNPSGVGLDAERRHPHRASDSSVASGSEVSRRPRVRVDGVGAVVDGGVGVVVGVERRRCGADDSEVRVLDDVLR